MENFISVSILPKEPLGTFSFLKKINEENGTTLVYTSHQLKEAEDLCQAVAMIDQGKIIAENSLQNLLIQHKKEGLEGLFLELTGRDYRD